MNEEHQWENEGGQVKPEPVDESEVGGESQSSFETGQFVGERVLFGPVDSLCDCRACFLRLSAVDER